MIGRCVATPYRLIRVVPGMFNRTYSNDKIINVICTYYALYEAKIISDSQKSDVVEARKVIAYFLKEYNPKATQKMIGKKVNRNRSTISISIQDVKDQMRLSRGFMEKITQIQTLIELTYDN